MNYTAWKNMMGYEVWKDIIDFEGKYQISNLGKVKSFGRKDRSMPWNGGRVAFKGQILKPTLTDRGMYVNLRGKGRCVHRLVAESFVPNPHGYYFVKHKNEDKTDNRAENLEWRK